MDNPPRTWLSAAWAYCLQKAGSAACAAVIPAAGNIDKKNASLNGSLFVMSFRPQPDLIPEGVECNRASGSDKRDARATARRTSRLPPPQLRCGPGPPAASSTAARHSRFTGRIGGIGATSGSAVAGEIESMFSVCEALRMNRL